MAEFVKTTQIQLEDGSFVDAKPTDLGNATTETVVIKTRTRGDFLVTPVVPLKPGQVARQVVIDNGTGIKMGIL